VQPQDGVIDEVVKAVTERRSDEAKFLLHPYLHWTERDGVTIRGRTKVLARLATRPLLTLPTRYELRDGQIYRWVE